MKISRRFKTIRNIILIGLLLTILLALTELHLTPLQAHKHSEKASHYGPSEIVRIFDHRDYNHYLCKYDKWISCNIVNRALFLFWCSGSDPTGFENDKSEAIDYSGHFSDNVTIVYGIANNPDITRVELYVTEDKVLVQDGLYENLFYFSWEDDYDRFRMDKIIGYNSSGRKVCERTFS